MCVFTIAWGVNMHIYPFKRAATASDPDTQVTHGSFVAAVNAGQRFQLAGRRTGRPGERDGRANGTAGRTGRPGERDGRANGTAGRTGRPGERERCLAD